jgi:LSD1 subclass zinc finger protein
VQSIDTNGGDGSVTFVAGLRSLLVCPACRGALDWGSSDVRCTACGATYGLADGIPLLRIGGREGDEHAEQQAAFFDDADPEFEITRPHGTPWFYSWLLGEKFRRSVDALTEVPTTAVTICGGSGMDAEYLAHAGAAVISTDVSLGAAVRARERAARYGLAILPVVAAAEALPLADASVDLGYVHDGLHHLEAPLAGLGELSRVSKQAVSVNEPAQAAATQLAVRIHLSEETEEAGNRVERVDPDAIVKALELNGFSVVRCERYAMVYRHEPGRAARLLSSRPLRPIVRLGIDGFNAVLGGIGNKLTVQAVRRRA